MTSEWNSSERSEEEEEKNSYEKQNISKPKSHNIFYPVFI